MSLSNYPPGAANDPHAPWNQPADPDPPDNLRDDCPHCMAHQPEPEGFDWRWEEQETDDGDGHHVHMVIVWFATCPSCGEEILHE